jgi:hypothetical protein
MYLCLVDEEKKTGTQMSIFVFFKEKRGERKEKFFSPDD